MKHYGDITKMNGAEIEPVEVLVGGSPCQDLSVAGRRAGLAGERSGLFMEQIRIIKEMRENDRKQGRADVDIRPKYMLWENVPGALSSGHPRGEDFRIVLEETARIVDPNAVIPEPPKGKWSNSGAIVGDGWSIAWTVRNARFFGVPQRRRRIALVASFGDESAPEILFEYKSREGNSREGKKEGEEHPRDIGECADIPIGRGELQANIGVHGEELQRGKRFEMYGFDQGATRDVGKAFYKDYSKEINNGSCPGHHNGVVIDNIGFDAYNQLATGDESKPLTNKATDSDHIPIVSQKIQAYGLGMQSSSGVSAAMEDTMPTITNGDNPGWQQGVCAPVACNWDGSQTSPTMTANNADGSQRMPDKDNSNCVLQPIVIESNQNHATIAQTDTSPTLPASIGLGGGYVPMVTHPVNFVDGWGGNMEKMFEADEMNTIRSAQPQVIVDDRHKTLGADIYNLALNEDEVVPLTEGVTSTGTSPKVLMKYDG